MICSHISACKYDKYKQKASFFLEPTPVACTDRFNRPGKEAFYHLGYPRLCHQHQHHRSTVQETTSHPPNKLALLSQQTEPRVGLVCLCLKGGRPLAVPPVWPASLSTLLSSQTVSAPVVSLSSPLPEAHLLKTS